MSLPLIRISPIAWAAEPEPDVSIAINKVIDFDVEQSVTEG